MVPAASVALDVDRIIDGLEPLIATLG